VRSAGGAVREAQRWTAAGSTARSSPNPFGHWNTETITFGAEPVSGDGPATYRAAIARIQGMLVGGAFPLIAPTEVSRSAAPCKQVVLKGDDIDLTKFAFIQTNPADAGRYVNTGSVFTTDVELGKNFGTYAARSRGRASSA
ncbi:MAG: UbiD family decarboxylase, partial [Gammaproteobacteria bacterium]|nr:UbiD family decarboxylase [Gammaproteobacteria bacterium]